MTLLPQTRAGKVAFGLGVAALAGYSFYKYFFTLNSAPLPVTAGPDSMLEAVPPRPSMTNDFDAMRKAFPEPWWSNYCDRAAKLGDKIAYNWLDENGQIESSINYTDLTRKVKALAHHLLTEAGLRPQDRVVLVYPPSLDFVITFFACLYAGITAVPIYPPQPAKLKADIPKLLRVFKDSGARICLTNTYYKKALGAMMVLYRDEEFQNLRWLDTEATLSKNKMVPSGWKAPMVNYEWVAFLQYTSGSTSEPKGVMVTHGGLLHNLIHIETRFFFDQATDFKFPDNLNTFIDRLWALSSRPNMNLFSWLPFYHDMGLIGFMMGPFIFGTTSYLMSPLTFISKPDLWMKGMSEYKCAITGGPNFAFELSARKTSPDALAKMDLSHVLTILNGAEPIRAATLKYFLKTFGAAKLPAGAVRPAYGMAENVLYITSRTAVLRDPTFLTIDKNVMETERVIKIVPESHPNAYTLVGCGENYPSMQIVKVIDPETLEDLGEDKIGEVWISAESNARGYWNNSEKSKDTFYAKYKNQPDEKRIFLRSGDYGFFNKGELYISGRMKDMMIIRGRNYYPQDIEDLVEKCSPEVRPGCVAAFSYEESGEELLGVVAEVKYDKKTPVEKVDALIDSIRSSVANLSGATINMVVLLEMRKICKTTSGKIQRQRNKQFALQGKHDGVVKTVRIEHKAEKDRMKIKKRLALSKEGIIKEGQEFIAEEVGKKPEEIDPKVNLVEYGLDSLAASRAVEHINETFGTTASSVVFLTHPTLDEFAEYLVKKVSEM
eukprot:TRINITY_DN1673_c0_g1::TRINITY_DN1673_c0_g1_i1::g.17650::m.17650 TRINITY_DN1673_c0_g1::TRINITY_DN1673_c0_g1_i1::g.17650  ORF type:complete len:777 (+),score=285.17,sp/Q7TTR2/FAA32_MYCBO/31.81/2e-89,AMP-binding/PF00501.23/1.3e-75,PP-binding/PF00550.20/1.8e-12,AMP-binding_C_2/PF14535.1/0.061,AMP-binding_C_2/PF14535.1/1.1e+03 TRINITY_DN1673_c0_g1_i1:68-2398(+)